MQPFQRPGLFVIFPDGPGYYSLRDVLEDEYREKPPHSPLPRTSITFGSFYDADFRYLEDPDNTQHDLFDPLKRIHCGDDWLLSLGGEERLRYMDEVNKRLTGLDDKYLLERTRLYGDLWYRDLFRVYAEYLDAQIIDPDLPPLPIDVNHSEVQNLFFDAKLGEIKDSPVYLRVGRQEMSYGSFRLVAPADWDNTRRTFEGAKVFWHSDKLNVDAFWVRPVLVSPNHFDSADHNRQFAGLWTTYRPKKGHTLDLYYLYLDQDLPVTATPTAGRRGQDVNTFGARYSGDQDHFLWDVEEMYQCGDYGGRPVSAVASSTGAGYQFAGLPMNPILWVYNDYASGDHGFNGTGTRGTFNQLFGFGHYYFGYIDVVGRQNIEDPNIQLTLNPTKWILTGVQGHFFYLDSSRDALYTPMGVPIRRDPTGKAGHHVGNEVDFYANFHLSAHQDILLGYSHLFAGEFLQRTGYPGSVDFFYLQHCFKW